MTERDGRYDASGFDDDTDWLMSQLGSGRRPDLEGRQAPELPVAPAPEPPLAEPAPQSRPRRRSEESLDWFSVAEPAAEETPTRALPVVGEPIERSAPEPVDAPAPPAWNQPAWNQPAWNPPAWSTAPADPPRIPEPPADPRLDSVEPPAGIVPPAFAGHSAPPPGPVTPPANFALTWGEASEREQPMDTEEGLRAAFARLADPSSMSPRLREPEPQPEPRFESQPEPRFESQAEAPEDQAGAESPFDGFTPPPVARSSFTPVAPTSASSDDFADELWSALHEDEPAPASGARAGDAYDDDGAYADRGAYADQGAFAEQRGYDRSAAYDARGYDRPGADAGGWDRTGDDATGWSRGDAGDASGGDAAWSRGGYDGAGHAQPDLAGPGYVTPGYVGDVDRTPYGEAGHDRGGDGHDAFDRDGRDPRDDEQGGDRAGYDGAGYDQAGYDGGAWDAAGYDRSGYDDAGYDDVGDRPRSGYDPDAGAEDGGYGDDEADDLHRAFGGGSYDERADGDRAGGGFGPDAYADTGDYGDDRFGAQAEVPAHDDGYDLRELWRDESASGTGSWSDEPADWREDVGRPASEPDDEVRWYADDLADRRRDADVVPPTADDHADPSAPWQADESPRAREFAQSGYLWNLTPDPAGRDPKVPIDDEDDSAAPGPRRGAATGAAAAFAARPPADVDDDPFGLAARDRRGDDGPQAFDDERPHDDRSAFPDAPAFDGWDAAGVDERTTERLARDEQAAADGSDDGLAALFGGAGFGATGPMSVIDASAAAELERPQPRDPGLGAGRGSDDPFAGWNDVRGDARTTQPRGGYGDRDGYGDRGGYGGAGASSATRDDDEGRDRSPVKLLTWVAGGLALVVLVVAVVTFGMRFLAPSDAGTAAPVASEEPVAAPTAPQPAGVHSWQALFGTECLEPFEDAWADEFTVVDCATPHTAQLAYRGTFAGDEAAEFPGEEALAAQSQELCAAEGIIDPATAAGVGELQMLTSFPVTAEQWDAGQRSYYCFVEQVSGEPLTVSLAGAGPAAQ